MAGFMDYVENSPFISSALPPFLAGLLVKKPQMDVGALSSYYGNIANASARANNFADNQAQFFDDNYRPAAVSFNDRAQSVGRGADLNEAGDRGAATFQGGFQAARANAERSMVGVNPNSGGAMARRGAIDASYAPGLVDAVNKSRMGREQYGDTLRATALPFLATQPNYATGMYGMATAANGGVNLAKLQNDMYRQQAGDVTKALKLPFDTADNQQRQQTTQGGINSVLDAIKKRFPTEAAQPSYSAPSGGSEADNYGFGFGE